MKNKTFNRLIASFLTVIFILSSLPSAFAAELQQDDSDYYYVNMPASGSDTLDLTDKTDGFALHVYDNGGAAGQYSSGCSGTLVITAPDVY